MQGRDDAVPSCNEISTCKIIQPTPLKCQCTGVKDQACSVKSPYYKKFLHDVFVRNIKNRRNIAFAKHC